MIGGYLVSEEKKELGKEPVSDEELEVSGISAGHQEEGLSEKLHGQEKISVGKRIQASFQSRMFRNGGYSAIVVAAVIVLAVLVNLFVEKLGIQVDMSTEGLYSVSEETEKVVNGLNDDITIYYVVEEGYEDAILPELLKRYHALSDHVTVKNIDPALHPKFVSNYTSDDSSHCVIVVNESTETSKFVDYYDMLNYTTDYTSYSSEVTDIDMEGQITSAIQFVTTEDVPKVYQVTGHGEEELCSTLQNSVGKLNVDLESLSTLSSEQIPEDCKMLLIVGPTMDYTEDEVAMIEEYLKNGGSAAIFTNYTTESMPNFESLLEYYGISMVEGFVVEQAGSYMGTMPMYLVPNVKTAHDVVTSVNNNNQYVVLPISKGFQEEKVRDTLEFTNVLVSSDGAYSKINPQFEVLSKEDGDIDGPFYLGIAVEEAYNDTTTKLAVYGSSLMINENMAAMAQLGNSSLFLDTINWMVDHETGLNIPTKSVQAQHVTVSQQTAAFWGIALAIVVPVLILAAGFVVYMRRRKA